MKKSILRILCFLAVLLIALGCWNIIFKRKDGDGIYDLKKYYELEKNTVDVLILGSSHAFENFNTGTLWDEGGLSSFILGGSMQPMWNTYYFLKAALKTQTPKLILLEGYATSFTDDYSKDSHIIKNTFGLPWSPDRVDAVKASAPKERWADFLLSYTQYHTRYKELSRADFAPNQGNPLFRDWKGFGCSMQTTPLTALDLSSVTESLPLSEKTEKYYRATLQLAADAGIPVVVLVAPFTAISPDQERYFNRAGEIAAEHGASYLNCNLLLDEIGINYAMDAADTEHLNYRGNRKFTSYVLRYLKNRYELADHRGDDRYATWQKNADYVRQIIANQELTECTEFADILPRLQNPAYWVFVSTAGSCDPLASPARELLKDMGIPAGEASILCQLQGSAVLWQASDENGRALYLRTEPHDFHLRQSFDDTKVSNTVVMDRQTYAKVDSGINIVVYDTLSEKIASSFGLDAENGYAIVR